jgi:hypothetical protein
MGKLRFPTPAMLVALVALVVASTGSAVAATVITSRQIKNGTIKLADISPTTRKALRSAAGPRGVAGPAGSPGASGVAGSAGAAGAAGRSALEPLHSGETVRGVWSMSSDATAPNTGSVGATFPIPTPTPVDSRHVVVQGNDNGPGGGCSGSAAAPVAAPGFVCIYFASAAGTSSAGGFGGLLTSLADNTATGDGSSYGFVIGVGGAAQWQASGTWAYTAP